MEDEKSSSNRFLVWTSGLLIPIVALGLYVYELFFKDIGRIPGPTPPAQQLPLDPHRPPMDVEMQKKIAQWERQSEEFCRNREFPQAIQLYERNLEEHAGMPPFQEAIKRELARIYYEWGKILYQQYEAQTFQGEPDREFLSTIREKLEKSLEITPHGPGAEKARNLLQKINQ